jgi:beta-lactamase class A
MAFCASPRFAKSVATLAVSPLALVLACGDAAKPAVAPASPAASASSSAVAAPSVDAGAPPAEATLPAGVPDTPAGHQLAWVLAAFGHPPSEADLQSRFSAAFNAKMPPAQVIALFTQIGTQLAPFAVDHVTPGPSPTKLVAIAHSEKPGQPAGGAPMMQIALSVEDAEPHRIEGLFLRPVIDAKPATSWDDVQTRLKSVAPTVNFLAAEVAGNKCVPISAIEPKKPLALGSAFKLYVLEALAKQIAAGKHKWDDMIPIEEAKKSLPSGDMRNEAAGKTFSVRHFAEEMISVSDNTATDHLLAFVGRSAAEETVKSSGNASAAKNVPFMSTRDLFALKLLGTPDELKTYALADVPHKRKLLEQFEQRDLSNAPLDAEKGGWAKPRMVDAIEWFASPEDLCKLMVGLKARADAPTTAPVGEILSKNPGLPDEAGAFRYIAFKGGSEPGVMNLTWLLQRKSDAKWVFLTVGFNDTGAAIDEEKAIIAVSAARDFLGK